MSRDLFDAGPPGPGRPPRRALVRGGGGWQLEAPGPEAYSVTAVNALGLALMVAYAYAAAWLKSQPWRRRPEPQPQQRPAVAAPAWERTRPPAVGAFPIGGVPARERTEAGGD